MSPQGFLSLSKPRGPTAFALVHLVRRLTGVARVGHSGTLDPMAEGVLVICLGRATKVVPYLLEGRKVYQAQVTLGAATDTYDAQGQETFRGNPQSIDLAALEAALEGFLGPQEQVPPMYSALKVGGVPLYQLARRGLDVPRLARPVLIHRLELKDWQPPVATLEVECGKGTYIRSLAHELGQRLGCGGHLSALIRTQDGPFSLRDSLDLCQLHEAVRAGSWESLLYPLDYPLMHLPAAVLGPEQESAFRHGRPIPLEPPSQERIRWRAYGQEGQFLGILGYHPAEGQWRSERVLDIPSLPN